MASQVSEARPGAPGIDLFAPLVNNGVRVSDKQQDELSCRFGMVALSHGIRFRSRPESSTGFTQQGDCLHSEHLNPWEDGDLANRLDDLGFTTFLEEKWRMNSMCSMRRN